MFIIYESEFLELSLAILDRFRLLFVIILRYYGPILPLYYYYRGRFRHFPTTGRRLNIFNIILRNYIIAIIIRPLANSIESDIDRSLIYIFYK